MGAHLILLSTFSLARSAVSLSTFLLTALRSYVLVATSDSFRLHLSRIRAPTVMELSISLSLSLLSSL